MGKKDKKKSKSGDGEKKAALQLKKEAKADKAARKRLNKLAKEEGAEQPFDDLLASYQKRDVEVATPVLESLGHNIFPTPPRANVSLTPCPHPSGSGSGSVLYLFGGEYYDGAENIVFDDLYRWDPDATEDNDDGTAQNDSDSKNDMILGDANKQIIDAQSSVAAGEWKQIWTPTPRPPARCSHAGVYFNGGLYIFGGELATADEYHHYKDLWRLDLKSHQWKEIVAKDGPTSRSGHRVIVWRHYMVVFGGFYEALRETKWHNDLYLFDFQTEKWTPLAFSKLSSQPPPRSGCNFSLCPGTDLAILSGGYSKLKHAPGTMAADGMPRKDEGKIHSDTWCLHLKPFLNGGKLPTWDRLPRRGEYPSPRSGTGCTVHKNKLLVYGGVVDQESEHHQVVSVFYDDLFAFDMERRRWFRLGLKQNSTGGRRRKKKDTSQEANSANDDADNDNDDVEVDDDEEENVPEGEAKSSGWDMDMLRSNMFAFIDGDGNIVYEKIEPDENDDEEEKEEEKEEEEEEKDEEKEEEEVKDDLKPDPNVEQKELDSQVAEENNSKVLKSLPNSSVMAVNATTKEPEAVERTSPLPRINPTLAVRANTLYIYGGLLEIGDREVTLDDVWTLDLHKRDKWTCVYGGTMHRQVWRGVPDDDTSSYVSIGGGDDFDDDDDEEEEESGNELEEIESEEARAARKAAKKKEKKKSKRSGVRDEIASLKSELDLDHTERTPQMGEAVADFYARTSEYWNQQAIASIQNDVSNDEALSQKELKREAFTLARERFDELQPLLDRLNELDLQQQNAEDNSKSKKDKPKKDKKEKRRTR